MATKEPKTYTDTELLDWCEQKKLTPHQGMSGKWYITSDGNRVTWGRGGLTIREAIASAITYGGQS